MVSLCTNGIQPVNQLLLLLSVTFALSACDPGRGGAGARLSMSTTDSANVRLLTLSHSMRTVSESKGNAIQLSPDLDLGGPNDSLERVTDITTLRDGRIAVLDGAAARVTVFSPKGDAVAQVGRRGEGPGEFQHPVALASTDGHLVVVQGLPTRTVTTFATENWRVIAVRSEPVPGDWIVARYRGPRFYDPLSGPDVLTWRLVAYDDTSFVYLLYPNEVADTEWLDAQTRPAAWVRLHVHGRVIDTVFVDDGPPLRRGAPIVRDQLSVAEEFIYASRPLLATGWGWFALAHGQRARIDVRTLAGADRAVIRWIPVPRPISDSDRLIRARWSAEYTLRFDAAARRNFDRASSRDRDRQLRLHAGRLPFADEAPEVMALYGAANCLAISGFAPADSPDGTSRTWVVVNIISGALQGVFRISRQDRRVRHIDARAIYAVYLDSLNVPHVERYPFEADCSADADS